MSSNSKNLNVPNNPITTMSDLMLAIQADMERIDSGELTESKARLKLNGHGKLLKGAELQLQHRRMTQGREPHREIRLIEPQREEPKKIEGEK